LPGTNTQAYYKQNFVNYKRKTFNGLCSTALSNECFDAECHCAVRRIFVVMLSVIMLNVVTLNVVAPTLKL